MNQVRSKSARTIGVWAGVTAAVTLAGIAIAVVIGVMLYSAYRKSEEISQIRHQVEVIDSANKVIDPEFVITEKDYLAAWTKELDSTKASHRDYEAAQNGTQQVMFKMQMEQKSLAEMEIATKLQEESIVFEGCVADAYSKPKRSTGNTGVDYCRELVPIWKMQDKMKF